jgi:hypothetical protein
VMYDILSTLSPMKTDGDFSRMTAHLSEYLDAQYKTHANNTINLFKLTEALCLGVIKQ